MFNLDIEKSLGELEDLKIDWYKEVLKALYESSIEVRKGFVDMLGDNDLELSISARYVVERGFLDLFNNLSETIDKQMKFFADLTDENVQ